MNWYVAANDGQQGPLTDLQLETLFRSGEITGDTLVWCDDFADWQPLKAARPDQYGGTPSPPSEPHATCAVSGQVLPESQMLRYGNEWVAPAHKETFLQQLREGATPFSVPHAEGYIYQDPRTRANLAKLFIAIFTVASVMITLVDLVSPDSAPEEFTAIDGLLAILGLSMIPTLILAAVFFCIWTHRVVSNAYSFGSHTMTISPGWAVGWYFIPLANLWKPFGALKEAWLASLQTDGAAPVMRIWWALWIITNIMGNISMRLTLRGEMEAALILDTVGIVFEILLLFAVFAVINQLTRAQVVRVELPSGSAGPIA